MQISAKVKYVSLASAFVVIVAGAIVIKVSPTTKIDCGRYIAVHNDLKHIAKTYFQNNLSTTTNQDSTIQINSFQDLKDRWGNPFRVVHPQNERRILLYSIGKNGLDDNGLRDDIVHDDFHNRLLYCKSNKSFD